jgi:hypothetical protein
LTAFHTIARVLRVLIIAGLALSAFPVSSALAQTPSPTIGQTGSNASCGAESPGFGVFADTNYEVPSLATKITSFSFQSTPANSGSRLEFLVLRPAKGSNYTVVGTTGLLTLAGTGLETFQADIGVQEGDILGFSIPAGILQNCQRFGPGGGLISDPIAHSPQPSPGDTFNLTGNGTSDLNLSATVVLLGLGTSSDQCKNGGWQTFGVFKNQGDCVSFFSTGGRNGPSGG